MRIPECDGADNSEVLKAPAFAELHVRPTYHLPNVNPSSPRMKIGKIEIARVEANRERCSQRKWRDGETKRENVSAWRLFSDGITPTDTVFIDRGLIDVPARG